MTVELILRYLAKVGLVPKGLPGRRSAEWSADHLKNLILSFAAYLPSDAVVAVRTLNGLRCNTNDLLNLAEHPMPPSVKKGTLFGDWIVEQIEKRSHWIEDKYNPISNETAVRLYQEHYVSMTVDPPGVVVITPSPDEPDGTRRFHYDTFGGCDKGTYHLIKYPVLFRETRFTVELLIAAGRLLADTLAKQTDLPIPDPVPGRTGEGGATPETTKAAGSGNHDGLLFDTPASRKRRQRPLNKAQPTASQGSKQLLPPVPTSHFGGCVRDAGHSTSISKGAHHGTTWTDAAPS